MEKRRCSLCVSVGLIVAISSGLTACVRGSSNAVSTMIMVCYHGHMPDDNHRIIESSNLKG